MRPGKFAFGLLAALPLALLALSAAHGAVILDSTWHANGGTLANPGSGFGANQRLAAEPQFAATVNVAVSDGAGSGVWIGDDAEGHGIILTAAHLLFRTDENGKSLGLESPRDIAVTSDAGGGIAEYEASRILVHPDFDMARWNSPDLALVVLDKGLSGAGAPPLLYCGVDEVGQTATIVGYGMWGIGSVGEDPSFQPALGAGKLAIHNRIDAADFDHGGTITIDFDPEDGNSHDAIGPAYAKPVDPYEGLPSNGDSGAPLWIDTKAGWAIAGIVKGGPSTTYGSLSQLVRVTGFQDWIHQQFPNARFDNGAGGNCGAEQPVPESTLNAPDS